MTSALAVLRGPRLAGAVGIVFALALLFAASAWASSDLYSNVGPGPTAVGGLADRYPLGNYALDQHFDAVSASLTGGVDVSGVPPMIAYFLANALWQITAFLANALITVFTFAFSLDLVNGSAATGGAGALQPVSDAVRTIYSDVFGEPWLVVAVVLTGLWAIWHGLVQRRYTETAGSLGLSVVFVVIALAFVTQPERTIGQASQWTNQMSAAFLSLSAGGSVAGEQQAKRAASDQLFGLLVYQPWTVLQFGGLEHCAKDGTGSSDSDPVSVPVRPLSQDPGHDTELRRRLASGTQVQPDGKTCVNNANKYAPHFLRFSPGSDERNAEYKALNDGDTGELPDADPAKQSGDYQLGVADKPATDTIEKNGQYQRLLIATVAFGAELGAFLLLGALSIGVILAQVLVLLLLTFAPVALVVGVFPGRGHDFFRRWLTRLIGFLLRKAVYSLILAVLLAVAAAVASATAALGWLLSFSLQAAFFWAVFLWRHQLADSLLTATAGADVGRHEGLGRLVSTYYALQLAGRPAQRLGRLGGRLGRRAPTTTGHRSVATTAPPAATATGQRRHDAVSATDRDAARGEAPRRPVSGAPTPPRGSSSGSVSQGEARPGQPSANSGGTAVAGSSRERTEAATKPGDARVPSAGPRSAPGAPARGGASPGRQPGERRATAPLAGQVPDPAGSGESPLTAGLRGDRQRLTDRLAERTERPTPRPTRPARPAEDVSAGPSGWGLARGDRRPRAPRREER